MPSKRAVSAFHTRLHRWYQQHGRRNLPWRNTSDPYAILVSEMMLQQTQVKTVLERFYTPFLKRFPTLKDLADTSRAQVMKAWEGLGYYRRAGYLHEAAAVLEQRPLLPSTPSRGGGNKESPHPTPLPEGEGALFIHQLMALPGIGKNTAHALAAFAYHQPVAVMEANVKRVLCRVFALQQPKEAELWDYAEQLLDVKQPFDYNQAMMDVGAMVCTKSAPKCGECPANAICEGKDSPEIYPTAKKKKAVPVRRRFIAVFRSGKRFYLKARESALLGGLYGFEQFEHEADISLGRQRFTCADGSRLGLVTHVYSHFKLEGEVVVFEVKGKKGKGWHTAEEIEALPLSKLDAKVLGLVSSALSFL